MFHEDGSKGTTKNVLQRSFCKDKILLPCVARMALCWKTLSICFFHWHWSNVLQPKVFSKSETVSSRILSSTKTPNRIIYAQSQEYTLRLIGTKKVSLYTLGLFCVYSLILLWRCVDGKINSHCWPWRWWQDNAVGRSMEWRRSTHLMGPRHPQEAQWQDNLMAC